MLSLYSFSKSFGDHTILEIPEWTFPKGIHWVKGKNGSGKSTFFNCLAGLSPFKGTIKLNDIDLSSAPEEYKLKVNYSQSEPQFPEFLRGQDLVSFFSKLKQAPPHQVADLMEALGVSDYAHTSCGTYSSGMNKKLSIILSFLGNPEWIVLDEPLITLDKEAQQVVTDMIVEKRKAGVSFIFATHQDFENAYIEATHTYEIKDAGITRIS